MSGFLEEGKCLDLVQSPRGVSTHPTAPDKPVVDVPPPRRLCFKAHGAADFHRWDVLVVCVHRSIPESLDVPQSGDVLRIVWMVMCWRSVSTQCAVGPDNKLHRRPARPCPAVEPSVGRVFLIE